MAKSSGIDKEALKRNQFWIVLGLFGVLWLVSLIVLKTAGNDEKKKAWEKAKTDIKAAQSQGPKTEAFQLPWKEHGQKFRDHKDVIWREAWEQQKDMYTWPESMPVNARPLYIDDPFARDAAGAVNITQDLNNRNAFKQDWYAEQFAGLDQYVYPAEFTGGFFAIFPMQTWDRSLAPTREEIWLAQEDFWVRREMLFIIRNALDATALFRAVDAPAKKDAPEEKLPDGLLGKRVFRNTNWELTLFYEKSADGRSVLLSDKSKIKNINPAERTLVLAHPRTNKGLPFRLIQGRGIADFRIAGEPLPFGGETTFKQKFPVAPVDLTKEYYVEQVLDLEISPIRRIEALQVAYHSHRTMASGFKINEELKKLDPEPEGEAAPASGAPPGGAPPGGAMMGGAPPSGMAMGGRGEGAGAAASGDATRVNMINRQRYLHITPQCKAVPIAMRLVIDQSHIHDVLTAFANSRLRLQITQVTLHHVPDQGGSAPPPSPGASGGTAPPAGPPPGGMAPTSAPGAARSGRGGMAMPPGMGGGAGPAMMGGMGYPRPFIGGPRPGEEGAPSMVGGAGGAPGAAGPSVPNSVRLVELTVYAIASLYERFPPRAKDPNAPATPGPTK
ncbi:MAG: hypothetical protein U0840_20085 [Gemmataceae bacterium]